MSLDFYTTTRYKMAVPGSVTNVSGGVIMPSGIPLHTLQRRDLAQWPHLKRRLFDPQLYLSGLRGAPCKKACVNLATYGWFATKGLPAYQTAKHRTQAAWKNAMLAQIGTAWKGALPKTSRGIEAASRTCLATQQQVGCEALIVPSPLTSNPTTSYATELAWLDAGLDLASRIAPELPTLATVALSDTCLRGVGPYKNVLLDLILDQVAAREPDGVYLVLEQANDTGYFINHRHVIGSLLRLADEFRRGGLGRVVVSYAGMAGLLTLAAGADTWATEWYRGERRLRLPDFEDAEGRAVPALYSHRLAGEIHMQSDLDTLVAAGQLQGISDITPASTGLMAALMANQKVSAVPDWAHRPGNITAAREHLLHVATRETNNLAQLDEKGRRTAVSQWLSSASTLATALYQYAPFNPRTSIDHQEAWMLAWNDFLANR
jgi:hypothetical protein